MRTAPRNTKRLGAALAALAGFAALVALAAGACNATPTVPVPPPEFCAAEPPDADGFSQVGCDEGYTARDVALVYNEDWGQGVMQATEEDGSFLVEVVAEPGDRVLIQLKHEDHLSAEVQLTIPSE